MLSTALGIGGYADVGRHSPIPHGLSMSRSQGSWQKLSGNKLDGGSGKGEMHKDLQAPLTPWCKLEWALPLSLCQHCYAGVLGLASRLWVAFNPDPSPLPAVLVQLTTCPTVGGGLGRMKTEQLRFREGKWGMTWV